MEYFARAAGSCGTPEISRETPSSFKETDADLSRYRPSKILKYSLFAPRRSAVTFKYAGKDSMDLSSSSLILRKHCDSSMSGTYLVASDTSASNVTAKTAFPRVR